MKRTLATTTFAFAILGVTACKGGAADAAKLIPDSASMVGGVDLAALQQSKLWTDLGKEQAEKEGKAQIDAMGACNVGLDKWKSVTFGASEGGDMAVVVVGDGLGKKDNLDCAHGKLKEQMGSDPWTAEEDGKVLKNVMGEGNVVYVLDDSKLVYATKGWADTVQKLTKGEGTSAFDGPLKDAIGRTDTGKTVWMAGKLGDRESKGLGQMLGGTPKDAALWVDVGSSIEAFVSLGMASADEATAAKDKAQAMFDQEKAKALIVVPQSVVDKVKIDASGSAVTATVNASDTEIDESITKAKAMIAAMGQALGQ